MNLLAIGGKILEVVKKVIAPAANVAEAVVPGVVGGDVGRKFKTAWFVLPGFVLLAHFLKIDVELVKLTMYGMLTAIGVEGLADIKGRISGALLSMRLREPECEARG